MSNEVFLVNAKRLYPVQIQCRDDDDAENEAVLPDISGNNQLVILGRSGERKGDSYEWGKAGGKPGVVGMKPIPR